MDINQNQFFCNSCYNPFDAPLVIYKNCSHYSCTNCAKTTATELINNTKVKEPSRCHVCYTETGSWLLSPKLLTHGTWEKYDFVDKRLNSYPLMARNVFLQEFLNGLDRLEVDCRIGSWRNEMFYRTVYNRINEILAELASMDAENENIRRSLDIVKQIREEIILRDNMTEELFQVVITAVDRNTELFKGLYAMPIEYLSHDAALRIFDMGADRAAHEVQMALRMVQDRRYLTEEALSRCYFFFHLALGNNVLSLY